MPTPAELLKIESVEFGWEPSEKVLDIDSLLIQQGQHSFVMGPSGCGKSTLLSMVGGVIVPSKGQIELNGSDITQLGAAKRDRLRADSIGFIFQQFNLVPFLSAIENVLLPCQFSRIRGERAKNRAGTLQSAAEQLLDQFFTNNIPDFNRPVAKLSVGQQQRVAAARALIGSPALIIADEPTSALDHDNRFRFMSLLMEEANRQESTLLFVSHDPTLADQFSQVLKMTDFNRAPDR